MSNWKVVYTKRGLKDKEVACRSGFAEKVADVLAVLREDPFAPYPPYEKLIGELYGAYSRRINRQHRVVYQIYEAERIVKIISMWLHYE